MFPSQHCAQGRTTGFTLLAGQPMVLGLAYFLSVSFGVRLERNARKNPTIGEVIMLTIMPTETASGERKWLKT